MKGKHKIILIAGPNGAGKTTFARQFLPQEADCPAFINADLIAAGLSPFRPQAAALRAGRSLIAEIAAHVARMKALHLKPSIRGLATPAAYRVGGQWDTMHSDPALVGLILRDLVSNAIRYTKHGGVLVGCRKRGGLLAVEVRDTGIGIAPEHHETIFQEFHQLGNPERDRQKGLGLGLAIVRGLARTLGHTLSLDSGVGRGSVFRLMLPLSEASPAIKPTSVMNAALPPIAVPLTWPAAVSLQGVCVLVIDDETVRTGMLQLLRGWRADCHVAESIDAALVVASVHPPALVISDYRLREQRTGAQAIAALRKAHGAALPALLITGDTAPERLREAQASGVPLLHKPVDTDELLFKIKQLLN